MEDPSQVLAKHLYERQQLIGVGSFSRCYTFKRNDTNEIFVGKITPRIFLAQASKARDIMIHRAIQHPCVVKFETFWEDDLNVFTVMEMCCNGSLKHLVERRNCITEYECQYYMHQILQGVKFMHRVKIVHRNLLLENILLNDRMQVKITDFSLATTITYEGERKYDMVGSASHMAPEIKEGRGHSYEVDIWSIGLIMKKLLNGLDPKQTAGYYKSPRTCSSAAINMINRTLQLDYEYRPKIGNLLKFQFLRCPAPPKTLPLSCLAMEPHLNSNGTNIIHEPISINENYLMDLQKLHALLTNVLSVKPKIRKHNLCEDLTYVAGKPLLWVRVIKYLKEEKILGYQLSDKSIGVSYNDSTVLVLLSDETNVLFVDSDDKETCMTITDYRADLYDKMITLQDFKRYLFENPGKNKFNSELINHGGHVDSHISRVPHIYSVENDKRKILIHLTNGTLQLNYTDAIKMIFCPRTQAVTYIDKQDKWLTYKFCVILKHGCSKDLYEKLCIGRDLLDRLLQNSFNLKL